MKLSNAVVVTLILIAGCLQGCSIQSELIDLSSKELPKAKLQIIPPESVSLVLKENESHQITLNFEKLQASDNPLKGHILSWKIIDGEDDFEAAAGTVLVSENATTADFTIKPKKDIFIEADKTFTMELSGSAFPNASAIKFQIKVLDQTTRAALIASSADFSAQLNQSSTLKTVTLTNNGDATAENILLSNLSSPFLVTNDGTCTTTLAGHSSCTLVLKYEPSSVGSQSSDLLVAYNNPDLADSLTVGASGLSVEVTSILGGLPSALSNSSPLDVTVSGTDVLAYKFKLGLAATMDCAVDSGYSAETPIATHITNALDAWSLQNLKLCVIGKESHHLWQPLASASSHTWFYDNVVPSVSVNQALTQADPAKDLPVHFTVIFSEPILPGSFTTADISQTGTATGVTWTLSTTDNVTWDLQAAAVGMNGTLKPVINAGTIQDPSGNGNLASISTDNTVLYDSIKPTLTITQKPGQSDPTNSLPIEFNIVFSEVIDASTFDVSDITQNGAATGIVWALSTVDNKNWQLKATAASSDGTVVPSVAAGKVLDLAGNSNTASVAIDNSVDYNTTAPDNASSLAWQQNSPSNATTVVAQWTKSPSGALASQKIQFYTGLSCDTPTGAAINLGNATQSQSIAVSNGNNYTYKITSIDTATNEVESSCSAPIAIDTVAPTITTVTSAKNNGSYRAGELIDIEVTFSEDITVTGTPTLLLNTTPTSRQALYISGSGGNILTFRYTVLATDTSADLDYNSVNALAIAAATLQDSAGNNTTLTLPTVGGANSIGGQKNIVIDTTAPSIDTLTITNTSPTNSNTLNLTSTLSGAPVEYCILENNTNNGSCVWTTAGSLPATFTATLTNESKTLSAWVKDLAGNISARKDSNAVIFDNIAPLATLSGQPTGNSAKYALNIDVAGTDVVSYKYKLGSAVTCTDSAGYSAEISASTNITDNISALANGTIQVCVVGKDTAGNWQTYTTSTTTSWTKATPALQFASASTTISEFDSPTLQVTVSIPAAVDIAVSATYTISGEGLYPATEGSDYTGTTGTVSIPAGSTSAKISIPILDDIRDEYDEALKISLSLPVGSSLGAQTVHVVTISDDDDPPLITIQDVFVIEGTGTTLLASLSTPTDKGDVTINWGLDTCTGVDCASSPTDYTMAATSGTAVIPMGSSSVTFGNIQTVNNAADELYRRVPVKLTGATGGTLYSSKATVYINDNDVPAGKDVIKVGVASGHACALTSSGKVYCWGRANYYQTGQGNKLLQASPVEVTVGDGSSPVVDIDAHYENSCAITAAGALYCWGLGSHATYGGGYLGNGSSANNTIPTLVTGMNSGVTSIGIGFVFMCALKDGGVYCWGTDQYNTLGRAPETPRNNALTPLALPPPLDSGITKISVGLTHVCAIKNNNLYCWGANTQGELGQGTQNAGSPTPLQVTGIGSVVDVWAGTYGTCAKNSLGEAYCWGNNNNGEVRFPTSDAEEFVTRTPEFDNASFMSFSYTVCAITSGELKCRGRNHYGGLGTNQAGSQVDPVLKTVVGGESNVTDINTDQEGNQMCFVRSGQIYCTGYGGFGNLADGFEPIYAAPALGANFSGAGGASRIALGTAHACGIFSGGAVKCWGDNNMGRAGNLLLDRIYLLPTEIKNLTSGYTDIAVGGNGSCAISSTNELKCWGTGYLRGVNSTSNSGNPVTPIGMESNVTNVSIYALGSTVCAVKSGKAYCWGDNVNGALGTGDTVNQFKPYEITALGTDVVQSSVGGYHTCFRKADGTVWCAGLSGAGQLGQGDLTARYTHTQVPGITTATSIATSGSGACAILADKTLKCWGSYHGTGTGNKTSPVTVTALSNVTKIVSNHWNICALDDSGIKCWGDNVYGQMGLNELVIASYSTPQSVTALNALGTVTDMAMGGSKVCAKISNNWYCSGPDAYSEFGRNNKPFRLAPVSIRPL